jgi:hypothetical protein
MKKTGFKDENGNMIAVGVQVIFENELFEVVKNVVPFNHFALYNKNRSLLLSEVHDKCQKQNL